MNNKEFVSEVSRKLGIASKDVNNLLAAMNVEVAQHLENEDSINIQGFGVFDTKKKLEHVVVNPATRQRMLVPPKIEIKFKASNNLKEKVN